MAVIPQATKKKIIERIDKFNRETFQDIVNEVYYVPEFKGKFLYLKRMEYGDYSPIARLTYTGGINDWIFDIYKYSIEKYDPEEIFFPGEEYLDGTIEGAMKAGLEAYPVC